MDWFSVWEPLPHPVTPVEIDRVDQATDGGLLTASLVLAVILLAAAMIWYRRSVRGSFWCAVAGREVEVRLRLGRVQSCSAFEDPTAIACGRRCLDRSFRVQWPPAVPLLARPRGPARLP